MGLERGREGREKAGEMRHLCKGIKALSAPSGILIGSAVFAAFVTSRQTDRVSDCVHTVQKQARSYCTNARVLTQQPARECC